MLETIPPNTAEWVVARRGILTASRMADVLAVKKDGKPCAARQSMLMRLVAERLTGISFNTYVTPEMQWGLDCEPDAILAYEVERGVMVDDCGLVLHPTIKFFGATPDRAVGEDGLVEVKCPQSTTHLSYIKDGELPDEYEPQVLAQLACTGRQWCDFVSFDPRLPDNLQTFIVRVDRDESKIAEVEKAATVFLGEVLAMVAEFMRRDR